MTTCKNCASEFEGKYCPSCGQKASVKRFSTKILFSQLIAKLLPVDRGVLLTTRHLITRPGYMLRGYLDGKRANYTKPFQFLLIVTAITLLFFSRDQFEAGMQAGMNGSTSGVNAQAQEMQKKIADLISSNLTLLMLGMLPFLALTGRWFYRKHDVNYAEHFVVNCYVLAACSLLSTPFMAMLSFADLSIFKSVAMAGFMLVYLGYFTYFHLTFFKERNRIWNAIKGTLTFLIAYALYILAVGLFSVIAISIYVIWNK
jgi:hypothetical protein